MDRRQRTLGIASRLLLLMLMASPAGGILGQDPVNKPPPVGRLPAPRGLSASQMADGSIRVVWSPIRGATSYYVVRSVPPEEAHRVGPNPTDTVFIDKNVEAGKVYYYVVAGITEDGATGLKAGSPPVKATMSAAGLQWTVIPAPTSFTALLGSGGDARLTWRYGSKSGLHFIIEREVLDQGSNAKGGWSQVHQTTKPTIPMDVIMAWTDSTIRDMTGGTRLLYRVTSINLETGIRSAPVESAVLVIGTPSPSSGSSTGSAPAGSVGTVAVSMTSLSVRVGATSSLGSAVGASGGSKWISLDEGIATVDASGTASGRAPGRAQILAISRGSDGAVRVTLVQVTVTP